MEERLGEMRKGRREKKEDVKGSHCFFKSSGILTEQKLILDCRYRVIESSSLVPVLFREVFSHPYISFFHLLVNGFSVIHNIYGQTRLHYPARLRARVISKTRNTNKSPERTSIIVSFPERMVGLWSAILSLSFYYVSLILDGPGSIASRSESLKNTKYHGIAATYYFVALGTETTGVLGLSQQNIV